MEIRQLEIDELPIVKDLAYRIWPSTYSTIISQEQIDFMLNWMYNIETLTENAKKNHFYFGIFSKDEPLGFTDLEIGNPQPKWMKIQKIYVLPDQQGLGLGKKLMQHAEEFAKDKKIEHISLQVNRNNKAVDFYKQIGYFVADEQDFDIGNGYFMNDFVMQKDL